MGFYFSAIIKTYFDADTLNQHDLEKSQAVSMNIIEPYARSFGICTTTDILYNYPDNNRLKCEHIVYFRLVKESVKHVETVYRLSQIFEGLAYFVGRCGCDRYTFSVLDYIP